MANFEIKNLSFTYPAAKKQALSEIGLTIRQGEYIALCGKSGSGKSTLLRHLKTVLMPHGMRSGEILFDGKPLEQVSVREQSGKIGYVMQNPDDQIVTDKVWHELAFGLESIGCDQQTMRLRVAEMASYFNIEKWFHKDVSELSGGQKQLLNLAAIMAMQPGILNLDEPTSQLDPIAAADFLATVRKINLELGTTILISEHRLEDVIPNADRVIVMEEGRIVAHDHPKKIGETLRETGSDMSAALPSPMQIFYGVDAEGDCPLTVREGRSWLTEEFKNTAVQYPRKEDTEPAETKKEPVLELSELWFRYEKESPDVLKGVSVSVNRGELFAVVGGNGTGKSTMLKSICGICRPYRGKILINGKRADKYKHNELFEGCLAMLPQDPQSLFVKKTVREDLMEMLDGRKISEEEKQERIMRIAEQCEITDLLDEHPYDLSGGEQQRSALAKVLLCDPKILLLDEPTKGIDNFFKIRLAKIFGKLKEQGVTIVMVSHDAEFCARYADKVSMFFDGSILTTTTPAKFFSGNSFYTTAANRMSRHIFENAINNEDVIGLYLKNKSGENI
ncbi:MAG: ATP-binding cassette domain-containing protein [Christensenellaceae bacterium]|nr:ATP-binding cassette domain-containing protein [Christensenellaceae bacterium]